MPRIKDYTLLVGTIADDDLQLLYNESTDSLFSVAAGRIPSQIFANFPANSLSQPGWLMFATNGRKSGEGAAAGTGILAVFDGTIWIGVHSEVLVTV